MRHQASVEAVAFSPDGRTVFTGSADKTARFWPVPIPVVGAIEKLRAWVQVLTSLELDTDGQVRVQDAHTWQQNRRRLDELGGPPKP
jgi:WD40 repeat protein